MLLQNNTTLYYVGVGKLGSMYGELTTINSMVSDLDSVGVVGGHSAI